LHFYSFVFFSVGCKSLTNGSNAPKCKQVASWYTINGNKMRLYISNFVLLLPNTKFIRYVENFDYSRGQNRNALSKV
jgi:hypothetical protein